MPHPFTRGVSIIRSLITYGCLACSGEVASSDRFGHSASISSMNTITPRPSAVDPEFADESAEVGGLSAAAMAFARSKRSRNLIKNSPSE